MADAARPGPTASPTPPTDKPASPDVHDPQVAALVSRYWRKNVTIMLVLLTVWAVAGLGCGVLLAEPLNRYSLGGYPLGFWFAQQGSIIVFVLVILVYCLLLNRLDAKHHRDLAALAATKTTAGKTDAEGR